MVYYNQNTKYREQRESIEKMQEKNNKSPVKESASEQQLISQWKCWKSEVLQQWPSNAIMDGNLN